MGKIVIKKKISLDFLGDDYKEGYLMFRSIALKDFEKYQTEITNNKDNDEASAKLIIKILGENFEGGKFPGEDGELFDVDKEQLQDFDITTIVNTFKILTGQELSPKA